MSETSIQKIKNDNLKKILSDNTILNFLHDNHLANIYVEDNYLKFLDYFNSINMCKDCQGLSACRQASKGQCVQMSLIKPENIIINEIVNCHYTNEKIEKERHLRYFVYNDIPSMYHNIFFQDVYRGCQDKDLTITSAYILSGKESKGIYLYGDLGVGKTYIVISLMNSLALKKKDVAFVKVGSLIEKLRLLNVHDRSRYDSIISSLKKVTYLSLDDIGTESVTSFSRDDILFNILDYRMEHKLTTIFTSNADIAKLKAIYQFDKYENEDVIKANRLIERVDKLTNKFCLKGENLRQK